jgi:hypothetical protein
MEWHPFYYKGEETNIEVNELGEVRKVPKTWMKRKHSQKLSKLSINDKGYLIVGFKTINLDAKIMYVHKIIAMVFLNHTSCGMNFVVDHIDRNKINNCLNNLRIVTSRGNANNRNKTSKYGTGVYKRCNKYATEITYNSKYYYIATFNSQNEASIAYNKAVKEIEAGKFDPKTFLKKSEK